MPTGPCYCQRASGDSYIRRVGKNAFSLRHSEELARPRSIVENSLESKTDSEKARIHACAWIWRSFLNPRLISLGGEVGSHPVLLHELETLLEGGKFPVVRVALGTLGSSAVLWGALVPRSNPLSTGCCGLLGSGSNRWFLRLIGQRVQRHVGRRHRASPAFAAVASGARDFSWPNDVSTLCQRAGSFFVSIAAAGSE
jgi:hypothetical protein